MAVINEFGMPFNDVAGDRTYSSADWRTYFEGMAISGVLGDIGNELAVTQQTVANKTVKIDTGAVLVKGAIRQIDVATSLTIADNTSGNPRIDRIIARLNTTDRKLEFAVLQGTPASSPVAPTLTQTAITYELSLAKIAVANGFSSITSTNITDERTFMTYRDRVLNDRMTVLEGDVSDTNIRIDAMDLAKYYGRYSQMSGGSTTPSPSVVTFNTEDKDDFGAINLATDATRITIPSGVSVVRFLVDGKISTSANTNSHYTIKLRKNGTALRDICVGFSTSTANYLSAGVSRPLPVSQGDYFDLYISGTDTKATLSDMSFTMEVLG